MLSPIGKTVNNWLEIDLILILLDRLIVVLNLIALWACVVINLIFDQDSDLF